MKDNDTFKALTSYDINEFLELLKHGEIEITIHERFPKDHVPKISQNKLDINGYEAFKEYLEDTDNLCKFHKKIVERLNELYVIYFNKSNRVIQDFINNLFIHLIGGKSQTLNESEEVKEVCKINSNSMDEVIYNLHHVINKLNNNGLNVDALIISECIKYLKTLPQVNGYDLLRQNMLNDEDILLGWHSNIACWFMDKCNFNHEVSNDLANVFINKFFDISIMRFLK